MLTGRKLPLTLAFVVLIGLAIGAGCRGFFVKPTLSSIALSPAAPTIATGNTGNTVQMTAVGTFNDGSTGNAPVTWSIAASSGSSGQVATISNSGLVTAVNLGTATITATSIQNPAIAGTQPVTVTVGCISSIALTPTGQSISISGTNHSVQLTATASTCTGPVDITTVASWFSDNVNAATVSGGLVTAATQTGTANITASSGGKTSPVDAVTVTQ